MRARLLRFGVQIPELLTQRKFVSVVGKTRRGSDYPNFVRALLSKFLLRLKVILFVSLIFKRLLGFLH